MDFQLYPLPQLSTLTKAEPTVEQSIFCPPNHVAPQESIDDVSVALQHLVKRVFSTGLLSVEDEAQLRQLMARSYCRETFRLLISLQSAAQSGVVVQASRQM